MSESRPETLPARQVWGPLELDLGGLSLPLLCPKCVAADVGAEKLNHGQKDLALLSEAPSLRDRRGGVAGSPLPQLPSGKERNME